MNYLSEVVTNSTPLSSDPNNQCPKVHRPLDEIYNLSVELSDKLWLIRQYLSPFSPSCEEVIKYQAEEKRICDKYGIDDIDDFISQFDKYNYGNLCGWVAALNWVLGKGFDTMYEVDRCL